MSNKIVEQSDIELDADEEFVDLDDTALPDEEDQASKEEFQEEEETKLKIPEKFKDKSIEDIVESYQNLEREYGRRNNEVGELRKLTDQLLNMQRQELEKGEKQDETPTLDVDSLLENPSKAIEKALETNPRLKKLEDTIRQEQVNRDRAVFEQQHPDWQKVVADPGFQKWITDSPARLKMFQEADKTYDYTTGAELIGLYKQLHGTKVEEVEKKQSEKRQRQLKDASAEKGGNTAASKKVYRRTDLIRMRMEDPDRFAAMEEEITRAYAEGRVR